MFNYINQCCIPSFPIGLAITWSDFVVRSDEISLGRWTLVVAVISSADAYTFLAFSDLTYHLETEGYMFSRCTVLPDSKETELESSNQEASPSTG